MACVTLRKDLGSVLAVLAVLIRSVTFDFGISVMLVSVIFDQFLLALDVFLGVVDVGGRTDHRDQSFDGSLERVAGHG